MVALRDMQTFSYLALATHQMERALRLFLDEGDYICAITLAGAGEEILGRLLEESGRQHALGSWPTTAFRSDGTFIEKIGIPKSSSRWPMPFEIA